MTQLSKKKIYVEILEAVKYGKGVNTRFAFKGQTEDGRSVTCFVKKEEWDQYIKRAAPRIKQS